MFADKQTITVMTAVQNPSQLTVVQTMPQQPILFAKPEPAAMPQQGLTTAVLFKQHEVPAALKPTTTELPTTVIIKSECSTNNSMPPPPIKTESPVVSSAVGKLIEFLQKNYTCVELRLTYSILALIQ